ncbi:hypothetical protein DEO72_LG2g2312 [Vigna unguiculata]|uniref:Uncharacterized protein n=1 Tax=Vigna unguiculata TaxID=3917 RepID=A0A4D6KY72_VIGUN|nr:hypothetical protein DEO72_LG2g2312 [Vigna unguiculata]
MNMIAGYMKRDVVVTLALVGASSEIPSRHHLQLNDNLRHQRKTIATTFTTHSLETDRITGTQKQNPKSREPSSQCVETSSTHHHIVKLPPSASSTIVRPSRATTHHKFNTPHHLSTPPHRLSTPPHGLTSVRLPPCTIIPPHFCASPPSQHHRLTSVHLPLNEVLE